MRLLVIFLFLFFIIKISPLYEKIERIKRFKLKNFIPKKEFVIGIAIGYGVNTQASDEIKQCFHQREEKNSHLIENFFKNINLTKKISKEQSKDKLEVGTIGFIKSARELFFEIKNCPPLRQSILSLVANKIMNLAVKGVIYMATGMTGVLIKTG